MIFLKIKLKLEIRNKNLKNINKTQFGVEKFILNPLK